MNCELVQARLTALLDSEMPPDGAAEMEWHLTDCPGCAQAQTDLRAVREMASAWDVDAPNISARVMQAIAADDQSLLLGEVRLLRAEMAELRAAVAALRRRQPRTAPHWTPPGHDSAQDYPKMENDPWNLIRS